jgi:phosphoglycerate dehydrogenase-like enzyme
MSSEVQNQANAAVGVAVTELEFRKAEGLFRQAAEAAGLDCFSAPAEEKLLVAAVRAAGARHVIVGVEPYTGLLYEALPSGGVIARFGVGHDGVNKPLASTHGLLCTNTPGTLDDSVAEFTISLLLAAARHTVGVAADMGAGRWRPRLGGELKGKTLAVIGCGPIGQRAAQIAARGFGMNVVGVKRTAEDAERLRRECGFATVTTDFAAVVRGADFVSLHIPSVPETRHFLNSARLALLPAGCWVVNTARGAVVDEVALFDALAAGRLGGAALDVFAREPYEPAAPGKDLRTLPNVIMTPHVGSSTREAAERVARRALQNIQLAQAGRWAEMDLLNRDVLVSRKPLPGEQS